MPKKEKAEAVRTLAARISPELMKRVHHARIEEGITIRELLTRAVETSTDHLFPPPRGRRDEPRTWSMQWRRWLRRRVERAVRARRRMLGSPPGEVSRWTIHGFRHTIATHLAEDLDVPPHVISLILGHTLPGPAVSRIYNRSELLPERRRALEAWADWLEALQSPPAAAGRLLRFPRD